MRVLWSKRAKENFGAALSYLEKHSPSGASRVGARIVQSILLLEDFPYVAPPSPFHGLRQLVVPSTPYIVVYRVAEDRIIIRAIIHAKQSRRR